MDEIKRSAPAVIATATARPDGFDLAQAAELELARAELLTDGQREARERAGAVVDRYAARGLENHALALEAQEVRAESWLTLHLWELNPDPDDWRRAEDELRTLCARYTEAYGKTNPLTLTVTVAYVYALVSQGDRQEAATKLDELLPVLDAGLGSHHPLYYRSLFLRGLIHAQRQQHALARPFFEEALEGQRATLGRMHAHTLRTEYELAVAMKLTEDPGWVPLMREVRDLASYARACS